jgi:hypothetical protein
MARDAVRFRAVTTLALDEKTKLPLEFLTKRLPLSNFFRKFRAVSLGAQLSIYLKARPVAGKSASC